MQSDPLGLERETENLIWFREKTQSLTPDLNRDH